MFDYGAFVLMRLFCVVLRETVKIILAGFIEEMTELLTSGKTITPWDSQI